jgi:hypothetical protein
VPHVTPTAQFAGVTLLDLHTMSGTNFNVHDQYQLQVKMDTTTGHPADYYNVRVYAELVVDQVQQPNLELGATDGSGIVTYHGQWGVADAGNWSMYLHAAPSTGGDVISQLYQWTVAGGPVKRPVGGAAPISVQLVNQSSGSLSNSTVGDQWVLTVSGPPGVGVYTWATHDGVSLPEVELGVTAEDGGFTFAGVFTRSEIGDWVEYYAVGRFQWPGSLSFTVQPAAGGAGGGGGGYLGA